MKKIYLIDEDKVKESSIIEDNVGAKIISNTILEVQDIELKSIIGSETYTKILSEVEAFSVSGTSISDSIVTLLEDYIEPFLIWGVLYHSFIKMHYKYTNKGLQKKTDTSSSTATLEELKFVRSHYESNFNTYKIRLVEHLKNDDDNTTNPEIESTDSSGWYFDTDYLTPKSVFRKTGY